MTIEIRSMYGHPEWIAPCASWWHRQWGRDMGYSLEGARSAIEGLTVPESREAALVALVDGRPVGSVFLVKQDLETHRHLSPWLAGLLVQSEFRGLGIGQKLVAAVNAQGAELGYEALYLYTAIPGFYERLGWTMSEEITIHDRPHSVMKRKIKGTREN